ncbi:MAG: thrombospondin type 3 repeat-containing protein [Halioglobus sp.]|nr:thrombospondin type 3 repeat-containing protein [Halioglobus sp.]
MSKNKNRNKTGHQCSALLLVLSGLLLFTPTVWAQLDISHRSFIKQPDGRVPTAVATGGLWSAMGRGELFLFESSDVPGVHPGLIPHRVTVDGPWSGSPYREVDIEPPVVGNSTTEEFGAALAIQGFRIAIGAPAEHSWISDCTFFPTCTVESHWVSGGGKVRLYLYDGANFQAERVISFGALGDQFGKAVALERWNLLVGSPGTVPGSAHVFDPDTGTLIGSFASPDATGDDGYGLVVALDDDLAIVGAPGADTVYVYRDDGNGNWSAAGNLDSPGNGSQFGAALAADGERIIVGAPGIDEAHIFEDDGDAVWPVAEILTGTTGSDFGRSVAITGDTAFVGAPELVSGAQVIGVVERYDSLPDGTWLHTTELTAETPADNDNYGEVIAASSRILTVLEAGRPGQYVYTSEDNIHDADGDNIADVQDNCLELPNTSQTDTDGDGAGNPCDDDDDGDGLSDTDEAIAGSDPLNPDSDGDGLNDSEDPYPLETDGDADGIDDGADNCPTEFNTGQEDLDGDGEGDACDDDIDGDGLSNAEEATLTTDPYDSDTDEDGQLDGVDDYPLDFNDGFEQVYRFEFDWVSSVAVGSGIVVARGGTGLRAYAEGPDGWAEVPGPPLPPVPANYSFVSIVMKGNRLVVLTRSIDTGDFILNMFEWSPQDGWSFIDSYSDEKNVQNLSMDGDTIAFTQFDILFDFDTLKVVKLVDDQLQLAAEKYLLPPENLLVSGDNVFTDFKDANPGFVKIHEASAGYSPTTVFLEGAGRGLLEAGPGRVLARAWSTLYWLEKEGGSWSAAASTVDDRYSDIGDGGLVGVYEQWDTKYLYATRVNDGSSLGVIQKRISPDDFPFYDFETNDEIVARVEAGWVDIFVLEDVVQPPGC